MGVRLLAPSFHIVVETEYTLQNYDIAPNGRFLAVRYDEEEPVPEQIVVIPDFAEELKAKFREAGQ